MSELPPDMDRQARHSVRRFVTVLLVFSGVSCSLAAMVSWWWLFAAVPSLVSGEFLLWGLAETREDGSTL